MYMLTLHSGGGSMSEAMDPQFIAFLETKAEALDLDKRIWDGLESVGSYLVEEGRTIVFEIGVGEAVDSAFTRFNDDFLADYEDEDY